MSGKFCWGRDTEETKALIEVEGGPMFRGVSVTGESSWMGTLRLLPAGLLSSPTTGSPPENNDEGTDEGNEEDGIDEDENKD